MSKFCVKKPFTVFVAVIIALTLSAVCLTKMATDLLPEMDLPYMMVITTYPGASPEKVESNVTVPMERSLGTVTGVKNVTSSSAENYSLVMLEFADGTDMDSAMVKVNSAIDSVKESLPEECGASNVMEMSMDMVATMYTSVGYEGKDIYELSQFTSETLIPRLERQEGVASVSNIGLVEKSVEVRLDQKKVDDINDKVLVKVSGKLADAKKELNKAQSKLDKAKAELEDSQASTSDQLGQASQATDQLSAYQSQLVSQQASLEALQAARQQVVDELKKNGVDYDTIDESISQLGDTADQMNQLYQGLTSAGCTDDTALTDLIAAGGAMGLDETTVAALQQLVDNGTGTVEEIKTSAETMTSSIAGLKKSKSAVEQFDSEITALQVEIQVTEAIIEQYESAMGDNTYSDVESAKIQAAAGFGSASAQIEAAEQELKTAKENYQDSREEALKKANLDDLLNMSSLSSIIYAQNFEMPAGYVDDKEDNQWLLKVGEGFDSVDDLKEMVLCHVDGIGDVKLGDVATITVVDNVGESYARVNGEDAIVLSIFKGSTASTSAVSKACNQEIEDLEAEYDGLHFAILNDQGKFITQFIGSIVSSMVIGAILAIIVLAVFLKDVKPTVVVAFSIPFSVLVAALLMYFSGITLNMMSLAGLALGIGMLVDNSIVVIENIYRISNRGVSAPRAAVQGARQVQGPILASTLTTICVFLPMIFTSGYTRQLMLPFALTITYALVASLLVSLTVVPTMGSLMLRRAKPKSHPWFDKILDVYGSILRFCLRVKVVPLLISVLLLAFSIFEVARMGIVMIPDVSSDQISVTLQLEDDVEKKDAYALADQVMERILQVDHVDTVGALAGGGATLITAAQGAEEDYTKYAFFVIPDEDVTKEKQVKEICSDIERKTADLDCELTVSSSSMGDMASMLGNGLQIDLYGDDLDQLLAISEDIEELVGQVEGFENISNGQEEGDQVMRLVIDKDEAMRLGLTVAQIYSSISDGLTKEKEAATVTIDGEDMKVDIVEDEDSLLDKENLLDLEFETTVTNDDGKMETEIHKLKEFAKVEYEEGVASIARENNARMMSVTAETKDGYNTTRLSEQVQDLLDDYDFPDGYSAEIGGEAESTMDMVSQMVQMLALGFLFIYLVMVAQFQSLLSPFIILFTVPLAFTGGLIGLLIAGEQLSIMSLMGFMVLMGTVVNNGIVFVDYTNQLRLEGVEKRRALVLTGQARMRPILMTALTTILSMCALIFSQATSAAASRGMAIVVAGGLAYATLMTLFVVPVMYDILYRKQPRVIDLDDEALDDRTGLLER